MTDPKPARTDADFRRTLAEFSVPSEHGNKYRAEVPVEVMVLVEDRDLMVRITDSGSGPPPAKGGDTPDLEAKLEGMQTPRGWGLFLIKSMVDEMSITGDDGHHTIELVVHLEAEGGK